MEVLKTIKKDNVQIQFVAIKGSKFRIRYEQRYDSCLPYDKQCFNAAVLTSENGWVVIAGEEDIMFDRAKFNDLEKYKVDSELFFAAMREHIELLYPNQETSAKEL